MGGAQGSRHYLSYRRCKVTWRCVFTELHSEYSHVGACGTGLIRLSTFEKTPNCMSICW
jgi:hypothetical protein